MKTYNEFITSLPTKILLIVIFSFLIYPVAVEGYGVDLRMCGDCDNNRVVDINDVSLMTYI